MAASSNFTEAVAPAWDRSFGDTGENVGKPCLWIDVVELLTGGSPYTAPYRRSVARLRHVQEATLDSPTRPRAPLGSKSAFAGVIR